MNESAHNTCRSRRKDPKGKDEHQGIIKIAGRGSTSHRRVQLSLQIPDGVGQELGNHVLGCIIIGGYVRGRPGDIDVVMVVDTKEAIGGAKELPEKMSKGYDLHPMTLEAFEAKIFSD